MTQQFDPKYAETEFAATIKLRLDTKDVESVKNEYCVYSIQYVSYKKDNIYS